MKQAPQIALLADGRRLHLQQGPIDLIVAAYGARAAVVAAYQAAGRRFDGLLDELCDELVLLRAPADPTRCRLQGPIARRMHAAVRPFAARGFITPMAAVAGAVAEEILGAMCEAAPLDRAYVNNGGDIALHIVDDERFAVGLVDRPDRPSLFGSMTIAASDPSRGIATSGWRGRSFSFGIADAVTVLAKTAAAADAAATVIANAVDLPGHPAVTRVPATQIQCDSDLGERLVTRDVAALDDSEVETALAAGLRCAEIFRREGLIEAAALHLAGTTHLCRQPAAFRRGGVLRDARLAENNTSMSRDLILSREHSEPRRMSRFSCGGPSFETPAAQAPQDEGLRRDMAQTLKGCA